SRLPSDCRRTALTERLAWGKPASTGSARTGCVIASHVDNHLVDSLSYVRGPLAHRHIVELAGAEHGQSLHHADVARDGEFGDAVGAAPGLKVAGECPGLRGEQHQLFALARIGAGDDGMLGAGPDPGRIALD